MRQFLHFLQNKLSIYFELTRPFALLFPIIAVISLAYISFQVSDALTVTSYSGLMMKIILGIIIVSFFTAGSNSFNQAYDLEIDKIVKPLRPLPSGKISKTEVYYFALICFVLTFFIYLMATDFRFFPALIAVLGILATITYSAPPLRLKRFLIPANIVMAFTKSFLLILSGWALVALNFNLPDPWILSTIMFIYFLGATSTKDFSDIEGDKKNHISTLPIKFGPRIATLIIAPFLILPFVLLIILLIIQAYSTMIFFHANLSALFVLSLVLILFNSYIAKILIENPLLKQASENHPVWKLMYYQYIIFYLGLMVSYSL